MKERMINFFFEEKFNFVTIEVECANPERSFFD